MRASLCNTAGYGVLHYSSCRGAGIWPPLVRSTAYRCVGEHCPRNILAAGAAEDRTGPDQLSKSHRFAFDMEEPQASGEPFREVRALRSTGPDCACGRAVAAYRRVDRMPCGLGFRHAFQTRFSPYSVGSNHRRNCRNWPYKRWNCGVRPAIIRLKSGCSIKVLNLFKNIYVTIDALLHTVLLSTSGAQTAPKLPRRLKWPGRPS